MTSISRSNFLDFSRRRIAFIPLAIFPSTSSFPDNCGLEDRLADVLVAVVGVEEREVALTRTRLPVQGARGHRRPVGGRRGGEVAPGVVGVACRHTACPGPCCKFAVIGVSIARTPPVCRELLRDESRRLPYTRGYPSSDSMRSVHP